MRNLIILSLLIGLGLPTNISANSSEEGIQKIINSIIAGKKVTNKKIVLQEIQFEKEAARINPNSKKELDKIAELLLKIPTVAIEISNHTDNKGNKDSKKQLTQKRAKSVVDYLSLKGIPYQQLNYKGWGWHRPMADNRSETGRQKNNRTELLITGLLKGPHQIMAGQNTISAANLVIDGDKIIYWEATATAAKNVALQQVQQIDLAYGKQLTFNAKGAQEKLVTKENPTKTVKEPQVVSRPKLNNSNNTKKTNLDRKKENRRDLVKTKPNHSKQDKTEVANNKKIIAPTPPETQIVEKKTIAIPITIKTLDKNKQQTRTAKNQSRPSKPSSSKSNANVVVPNISEEETQDLLTSYLTNYKPPTTNKSKPKAVYSETILKKYDSNFDWKINDDLLVQTTGLGGKIKYLFIRSKKEPNEEKVSYGGYIFHVGQQAIQVKPSTISLRYQDASGRPEVISLNKTLLENNRGFIFRIGMRFGTEKLQGYFAADFGGKKDTRYNAAVFGLMYRKPFGKFSVLYGAEINLGAGKFVLGSVSPETPIFRVKKKDFFNNNIEIAYKNKLLGLSPTIKLAYTIAPDFDIYISGGYMAALRTGSRIKFSGTGDEDSNVSTNVKLKEYNLEFSIDGEEFTRKVDILSYNGLLIRLGVFINMNGRKNKQ